MPVSNAALRKASRRTSSEGRFAGVEDVAQDDRAFGQRARLVGAQDVHAAEVLDGVEPAHDDAALAHRPGAGGERDADDRRQQFRRQADGQRHGEEQRTRSPGGASSRFAVSTNRTMTTMTRISR